MNYDIIGDVHGHREELEALFQKLDYERDEHGVWGSTDGAVTVFLGDFVDRGPDSRGVIDIVRGMMRAGRAQAVMGNHEYNAICYWTHVPHRGYMRPHIAKNVTQHSAFLLQYEHDPLAWAEAVDWFRTLPLFLELEDGPRIIHACWDDERIEEARRHEHLVDARLTTRFLYRSRVKDSPERGIIETLLKGPEERRDVPEADAEGVMRFTKRVMWWNDWHTDKPPVIFGHYWWTKKKGPNLGASWMCLDYSVARKGALACYRWRREHWEGSFQESDLVMVPSGKRKKPA